MAEIFAGDIQATLERWRKEAEAASARTPHAELRAPAPEYQRFRREFAHERRTGERILKQREWFPVAAAGPRLRLPVRQPPAGRRQRSADPLRRGQQRGNSANPRLLVLGVCDPHGEGEGPLTLAPHRFQFHGESAAGQCPPRRDVERHRHAAHLRPEPAAALARPLSPDSALLLERGKWAHNRAPWFDFDEILARREEPTLKATAALLHRESLLPASGQSLLDGLNHSFLRFVCGRILWKALSTASMSSTSTDSTISISTMLLPGRVFSRATDVIVLPTLQ